jgi:hypothetical protein
MVFRNACTVQPKATAWDPSPSSPTHPDQPQATPAIKEGTLGPVEPPATRPASWAIVILRA